MTYNVETVFVALDYLVIVDTKTPLGKTVLGAFHDFTDAECFLNLCNLNGSPQDSLSLALVDRHRNRLIEFSFEEALSLTLDERINYFNGKEK